MDPSPSCYLAVPNHQNKHYNKVSILLKVNNKDKRATEWPPWFRSLSFLLKLNILTTYFNNLLFDFKQVNVN